MFTQYNKFNPFEKEIWLSTPTMHGEEMEYVKSAVENNWVSTVGENINEAERIAAEKVGCKYAVGLSCGTDALHLCMKLANVHAGDRVASSDLTFVASTNPITYEGGVPVFIDSEYQTWNMDPEALEKALEIYPEIKVVVVANLYGTPAKLSEIQDVCKKASKKNGGREILIVEDAAESLGASYRGKQTGTFGTYNAISFNGNKIITGSAGGMLLTDDLEAANKARKWSTQSREAAPWYQHEESGFNYRMSNIIAGFVRGQFPHLEEHIAQKKAIYIRYKEGFKGLPVQMNPYDVENSEPNFWLSCMLLEPDAMCPQARDDFHAVYRPEKGKTCPTEILEILAKYNAEGRPIWKPLSQQPLYRHCAFVTKYGYGRATTNAYIAGGGHNVGLDIFDRGLCLPSDNKMAPDEQDKIIEIIRACFQ